jgi:hypothetical protein
MNSRADRRAAAESAGWHIVRLHWWARPHTFTVFFLIPLFVICAILPDEVFLTWKHAQNFILGDALTTGLTALGGFALAAQLASRISPRRPYSFGIASGRIIAPVQYRALLYCILSVTLAAYLLLLSPVIRNPGLMLAFFAGGIDPAEMRVSLMRMRGITSFVNLGPLYVTMLFLQATFTGRPLSRVDKAVFLVFLLFVIARVFLWSERAALVQVFLPIAVIRFAPISRHRFLVAMIPFIGILALALFFGVTEYFRSWTQFYVNTGISMAEFVLSRLFGYYATALNNGALIFTAFEPVFDAYSTAEWFYKFPLLSDVETATAAGMSDSVNPAFLNFGNPEFNNSSGLFAPMHDFGAWAGITIWIVLGALTGRLYLGFTTHRLMSMLLFPTWMIGVYEALRVFYWGGPGYFPVLALTPVVSWLLAHSVVRRRSSIRRRILRRAAA